MAKNGDGYPDNALVLRTYDQLETYLNAFASGHLNLLILVGSAGLAKSRTVRAVLRDKAAWIEGNATPFGMYVKLYKHRNQFFVIDDVDSLYSDKSGVRLLKCLCQTEEQKQVAWHSAARGLEKEGIPREFETSSRVIIICNDWRTLDRNVAALQDRGHVLVFDPTPEELHRQTGEWFGDSEVYEWFGDNLHKIRTPSMRHYVRAAELKLAGMPWKDAVPLGPENPRERLVWDLLSDESFETQDARVQEFIARGGGCRATYFNYARRMRVK